MSSCVIITTIHIIYFLCSFSPIIIILPSCISHYYCVIVIIPCIIFLHWHQTQLKFSPDSSLSLSCAHDALPVFYSLDFTNKQTNRKKIIFYFSKLFNNGNARKKWLPILLLCNKWNEEKAETDNWIDTQG